MSDEAALCTNKNAACYITLERTHKNNRRIYYITPHSARTRACFWKEAPPFSPRSHSHRESISLSSSTLRWGHNCFDDAGRAEGSCVTSRRFYEAVLRVIVSPPAEAPALCHHGRSGYQPLSLVPDPDGAVVCIAKRFLKKRRSSPIELAHTTKSF